MKITFDASVVSESEGDFEVVKTVATHSVELAPESVARIFSNIIRYLPLQDFNILKLNRELRDFYQAEEEPLLKTRLAQAEAEFIEQDKLIAVMTKQFEEYQKYILQHAKLVPTGAQRTVMLSADVMDYPGQYVQSFLFRTYFLAVVIPLLISYGTLAIATATGAALPASVALLLSNLSPFITQSAPQLVGASLYLTGIWAISKSLNLGKRVVEGQLRQTPKSLQEPYTVSDRDTKAAADAFQNNPMVPENIRQDINKLKILQNSLTENREQKRIVFSERSNSSTLFQDRADFKTLLRLEIEEDQLMQGPKPMQ